MKLLNKIYPEQRDFYKLLYNQSSKVLEGMKQLKVYMETGLNEDGERLSVYEKEADELRAVLIDELNNTFITPFEREDIFILSRAIDDMVDYSHSTFEEMQIFNLCPTEKTRNMTCLLVQAGEEINRAVYYLKDNPSISTQYSIKAKKIENMIETEYRKALEELFNQEDVKYIFKMREVLRHLSNLADKIDYTADIIGHIIVKKL